MAIKYVDPLGTDDASHGSGAGADAWATIHYALRYGGMAHGDTLIVESGTYSAFYSTLQTLTTDISGDSTTDGPLLVQSTGAVIVDVPANAATQFILPAAGDVVRFKDIKFQNTLGPTAATFFWLRLNATGSGLEFDNCDIDLTGTANQIVRVDGAGITCSFALENGTRLHGTGDRGIFTKNCAQLNFTFLDSYIYGCKWGIDILLPINMYARRSIVTSCTTRNIYLHGAGSTFDVEECLLTGSDVLASETIYMDTATAPDYIANPSRWSWKNNKTWLFGVQDTNTLGKILSYVSHITPWDNSNWYADPCITEAQAIAGEFGNVDFTLPTITVGTKAAFLGDSVMYGNVATSDATAAWSMFGTFSGLTMVDNDVASIGGQGIHSCRFWADRMMQADCPRFCLVGIGVNNMLDGVFYPALETAETIAGHIVQMMQKLEDNGVIPFWIGVAGQSDPTKNAESTDATNTLVAAACATNGWPCMHWLDVMRALRPSDWETTYFDALATNLHPNDAGHYVIADVADRLYQQYATGANWGARTPFDSTLPALTLAPTCPGKLKGVQEWKKVASAKEIGKY